MLSAASLEIYCLDLEQRLVRHGRVVQEDARLAVLVALVAEGVLDRGLVARGGAGEDVRAHGNSHRSRELDLVVVEDNLGEALAAVDREAAVLLVALLHGLAAHEVRHGLAGRRPEGVLLSLGGLEEHLAELVAVQLAGGVRRGAHVVAPLPVDLAARLDRVGPCSSIIKSVS